MNFQRIGSKSNSHVGKNFEFAAQDFFKNYGLELKRGVDIEIGIESHKKIHSFDLGCLEKNILVECKSHTWTSGNNVPSAKLTVWNEAMYYFVSAPIGFRKIFFVLRDYSQKRNKTLAEYYISTYPHLIPSDVEIWEFCENTKLATKIN